MSIKLFNIKGECSPYVEVMVKYILPSNILVNPLDPNCKALSSLAFNSSKFS